MLSPRPRPIEPQPGQESVWHYPRPAIVQPSAKRIQVICNGVEIADSSRTHRVLETSHPPAYYIPIADIQMDYFTPTDQQSFCEWKGWARYYTITVRDQVLVNAAWQYPEPTPNFAVIAEAIALYPGRMEACYVDGERVQAQAGDFYGGWITADIVGPFKGGAGTWGW
ncbi:DUF427 domain-containing protein [Spirulina sp. CCNP1310]|uniref:DUF427 domain-containing protein n=1 Tax=Spirulina sp. CCNP1310 TaxID=3110249 RepID=UPI002B1FF9F6|nr:DUF427 domain-containing protein [Spirulina sp. CCNP1310]MEA5419871.1 DUF427 domain-containing protein [Spirulina sp. CCNP1310]